MAHYVTGPAIKALWERKADPKQLAEQILVSDKAVSSGRREGLAGPLCWSPWPRPWGSLVAELLSGEYRTNANRAGHLLRSQWYVCPVCGNVVYALGQEFSLLWGGAPPAEAEEAEGEHAITVEQVRMTHYVTLDHPMSKGHFPLIRGLPDHGPVLPKRPIRSRRRRFASPYWDRSVKPPGLFRRKFHNICAKDHPMRPGCFENSMDNAGKREERM